MPSSRHRPSKIEGLVRAHQAAIAKVLADPLRAGESAGSQLYRLLVAPVVAGLPANARIVIVPDGSLHARELRDASGRRP